MAKKNFYAYETEEESGITTSWKVCQQKTTGLKNRFKGFRTRKEAVQWLGIEPDPITENKKVEDLPDDSIFFDSGTGGGLGTKIRVTDKDERPILSEGDETEGTPTPEGNRLLGFNRTNNYGELLACLNALQIAIKRGSKHIYGDSEIVIRYWSLNRVSKRKRIEDPDLSVLAARTLKARKEFEANGGTIKWLPGGLNPSDLGYHKD